MNSLNKYTDKIVPVDRIIADFPKSGGTNCIITGCLDFLKDILIACDNEGNYNLPPQEIDWFKHRQDGKVKKVIYGFGTLDLTINLEDFISLGRPLEMKITGTLDYKPIIRL
ncbi:MAG: hypothetical protein WC781_00680 [Candidatus Pacearchaeota archaeon]|jgi:hypothetical protein